MKVGALTMPLPTTDDAADVRRRQFPDARDMVKRSIKVVEQEDEVRCSALP